MVGLLKENYQAQKGNYRIIFYISEGMVKDGHFSFQTQLPKLKSESLQEKKIAVFHFFQNFEFGFLDFRLDSIEFLKCMT